MKPVFLFLISAALLVGSRVSLAHAQAAGTNQVGFRLGGFSGVTFRHINSGSTGVEADLLMNDGIKWGMLSLLYEKHLALGQGFVFNFGAGGFFAGHYDRQPVYEGNSGMNPTAGVEGVLGFEYYLPDVPIAAGLDLRPRFSLLQQPTWLWDAGLAFRYIF
jgi:hypothetical protein